MSFRVSVEDADGRSLTLSIGGRLTNGPATEFMHSETMRQLLAMRQAVVLDLRGLADYDAAGLSGLKELVRVAGTFGTSVSFINVPPHLDMVFCMSLMFLQAADFAYRA